MKRVIIFLTQLMILHATAQNFSYNVAANSVTFSGDALYPIHKDDDYAYINADYHWKDDGTTTPAAYHSGTYMKASAVFTFNCAVTPSEIFIRGNASGSISFPSQPAIISGTQLTYPETASTVAFEENKVRYYDPFTIHWQISFDELNWYDADSTGSKIYVTWHEAAAEHAGTYGEFKYFLSVFEIACSSADGDTTEEDIIEDIFNAFADHSVLNYSGEPLHYYKDIYNFNINLYTLLKWKDGQCYSWAQFFLAALKINGISYPDNYINISANYIPNECGGPPLSGFLAKTWTFGTPEGDCEMMPYTNIWDSPSETDTSYLFAYEEVTDEPGILGQTAANPASIFGNHQLTIIGDKYYDPCYGVIYDSLDDIKTYGISGWWMYDSGPENITGIDINGDGDIDSDVWYNILRLTDDVEFGDFYVYITSW